MSEPTCRICRTPIPPERVWTPICEDCEEAGDTELDDAAAIEALNRDLGENGGA